MSVFDALCHAEGLAVSSFQDQCLGTSEHLLATGEGELVDQLDGLLFLGIVFNFRLDEDTVAGGIVPDMYTERLDAHGIGLDKSDRTENTKGLTALREAPLAAAPSADPRRCCLHSGVVDVDL